MMSVDILVVPGYRGSNHQHWQTWLELQIPNAQRVTGVDWDKPVIHHWSKAIIRALDERSRPVIIVAHSFGCLASAMAVASRRQKVAGCIFVAPADPARFTPFGHRQNDEDRSQSIAEFLPEYPLTHLGLVIGSQNDPWMKLSHAYAWAERWGMSFYNAGDVGHINVESGHGAWPFIKLVTKTFCNQVAFMQLERGNQLDQADYENAQANKLERLCLS